MKKYSRYEHRLEESTRARLTHELVRNATRTGAALVPLDLSDIELLEQVMRIHHQLPSGLTVESRSRLTEEMMRYAAAVQAAIVMLELNDSDLLLEVARNCGSDR